MVKFPVSPVNCGFAGRVPGYIPGMTAHRFLANQLWLDFVNTEPVLDGVRVDLLPGSADVVGWLGEAGALGTDEVRRALTSAAGRPAGDAMLREAHRLRGRLRAGAERLAAGRSPGRAMVDAVNRVLASRPAVSRLVARGDRYVRVMEPVRPSALHLLVPIAESAAWLLEHGDPALVRRCGGPDCVLFFYDISKNHSRRWCSMDACGGRAKAGAYYRRLHPPAG